MDYKIYPTLLDAFEWWQGAEGEEEYAKREAELLDKVNRVRQEPSYAASRGTALNNCVDAVVKGQAVDVPAYDLAYGVTESGVYRSGAPDEPILTTYVDGFVFAFAEALVVQIAERVGDAVVQPLLSACVETTFGEVELYGYADYINGDRIIDLKSTSDYTPGKYRGHWQHRVYPLLAVRSGMMERVWSFDYLVAELRAKGRDTLFDGTLYSEEYIADLAASEFEVVQMLETQFLPWLENHRPEVTDMRIFGE